jgi:hypothetical protein
MEIKTKSELLHEKDKTLNEKLSQLGLFEKTILSKEKDLTFKEKIAGVKLGVNNRYVAKAESFPKPILSHEKRVKESKRISWATDSAISSQSPSSTR